jgi:hypothetical protein
MSNADKSGRLVGRIFLLNWTKVTGHSRHKPNGTTSSLYPHQNIQNKNNQSARLNIIPSSKTLFGARDNSKSIPPPASSNGPATLRPQAPPNHKAPIRNSAFYDEQYLIHQAQRLAPRLVASTVPCCHILPETKKGMILGTL